MNKNVYILLSITLLSIPFIAYGDTQKPIKKIKSFFTGQQLEKIDQRELHAIAVDTISIDNINGPITIKTGWKKNSVFMKTTKRAKKQEDLNNIKIVIDSSKSNHLAITTKHINKKLHGSVEYELIIPAALDVELSIAGHGDALIKDVDGNISIVVNDNITVNNTKSAVFVECCKKGSISIANTLGPVEATSHQGSITGKDITNSFSAHSTTGKINIAYKTLPATSSIHLETLSGNIMLALPAETNAEIKGQTMKGNITSDLDITLKQRSTKLNHLAWDQFKKEVDGTLGTGDAMIALRSTNGSVKITESKTV